MCLFVKPKKKREKKSVELSAGKVDRIFPRRSSVRFAPSQKKKCRHVRPAERRRKAVRRKTSGSIDGDQNQIYFQHFFEIKSPQGYFDDHLIDVLEKVKVCLFVCSFFSQSDC